MRVLLADPPAFTPQYDHELASALARAGAEVTLATSRFRFGETPPADGYRRAETFYPVSSRLFGGSRLLVAGDPLEPVEPYRAAAGARAEWRLGYLPDAELDRALEEATVALFPYRAELDQSGALLRALGAGVPAIVYDVGGLAEPVRQFGAGRVVAPGDVEGLVDAVSELLGDREALEAAREGARPARAG